ncbi:MAG: hypothetical protein U5R14_06090 [Gemmatimonadota bacterium]|nr:hypothetical protein [Gemmatimonadota bacterium]
MRKMLAVALCGLVTGFGGRIAVQALPGTVTEDPLFEDFSGQLPDALPAREASEQVVLIVSGVDVLSCEDLGRQVRDLIRTQVEPAGLELTVWRYDDASGDVERFIREERLRVGDVQPVNPEKVLGTTPTTPAVVMLDGAGRYAGVSYLNRTSLVRTTSFVDLLDISAFLSESQ